MVLRSDNDSVIDNKNICNIGAVVLAPTRELVIQIHEVLQMYLKFVEEEAAITANEGQASSTVSIASLLFTGGNDTQYDINAIESATSKEGFKIIIATPGRLSHLLEIVPLNRVSLTTTGATCLPSSLICIQFTSIRAGLSEISRFLYSMRLIACCWNALRLSIN